MNITPKQKLTIFSISSSMANTTKQEIEVVSVLETPLPRLHYQNGPLEGRRLGTMKRRGKRKEFHLDVKIGDLVFEGWDLPLITDFEIVRTNGTLTFSGNACFNFGLHPRMAFSGPRLEAIFIRAFILDRNLNGPLPDPTTMQTRAKCILVRPGDGYDDGELLWPEIEIAHAVVERMSLV